MNNNPFGDDAKLLLNQLFSVMTMTARSILGQYFFFFATKLIYYIPIELKL